MIFPLRLCKLLSFIVIIFVVIMITSATTVAQIPSITVKAADTTALPGATNTPITIFMDNIHDEVAALNIWIQLDPPNPDIMVFQTDTMTVIDTTYWWCNQEVMGECVDSTKVDSLSPWNIQHIYPQIVEVGSFDTTGTLISGWQYVETRSLSGLGTDINIVAISDFSNGSQVPPIPAGQQGGVLLRVLADVEPLDDTVSIRTSNMIFQTSFKDHFSFSRPDGSAINWIPFEFLDTTCFECLQWAGSVCGNWQQVPGVLGEPIDLSRCQDSMAIELDTTAILDTANVVIIDGSLTVLLAYQCGNIDGSPDGLIDISDLVYLVDYMFSNPAGPEPVPFSAGDVDDCAGLIDISDLVYLVDYMFSNPAGPAPCANCP